MPDYNNDFRKEHELIKSLKRDGLLPEDSLDKMTEEEKERKLRELRNALFKAFKE